MALIVNCECGEIVRGESEDDLVGNVERHVAAHHPELAGKLGRDDILAMSEET